MTGAQTNDLEVSETGSPPAKTTGSTRRLGSAIGLATISFLDLLALDDITTAGAWMPEIVFIIASIPALLVLGNFVLRRPAGRNEGAADE